MKKLRLLVTELCNRNCDGCCNKDWDLKSLPIFENFDELKEYDELMITGGEPMLIPDKVLITMVKARITNPNIKIYLYTAKVDDVNMICDIINNINGICVTLHEQSDVDNFIKLCNHLKQYSKLTFFKKSLRLNIFKEVKLPDYFELPYIWKLKENMTCIKNCPLPENEVFKRLKD